FSLRPLGPPSSPLFPYTTLFRSRGAGLSGAREAGDVVRRAGRAGAGTAAVGLALDGRAAGGRECEVEEGVLRARRGDGRARQARDRKSTRLNSSHQIISYAVFCL